MVNGPIARLPPMVLLLLVFLSAKKDIMVQVPWVPLDTQLAPRDLFQTVTGLRPQLHVFSARANMLDLPLVPVLLIPLIAIVFNLILLPPVLPVGMLTTGMLPNVSYLLVLCQLHLWPLPLYSSTKKNQFKRH